ncbi:DDE-type integrase/transposase/recombinase [Streptomyces sp. NPDC058239]|uniref:DDE-type integrase/transposase/recombinase n=1 Tax=Streptomyces sp. NPDC058239 TaxID=3346395 RepID=UPI0036F142EC
MADRVRGCGRRVGSGREAPLDPVGRGLGDLRLPRVRLAGGRVLTTIPDPRAAFRPDLVVRDFQPDRTGLDARWCGDITYVPTEEGWLYLATVIDIASRRVVGWAAADHLRTELVADALTAACRQRRPTHPVIFHSDRDCQYTSKQFAALAAQFGVRLSVGRTGQCWDNALAELFLSTITRELLGTSVWPSRARRPHRDPRFHRRLVQRAPTAQQPRLLQPRRVRDRTRSLTTTPMVSVKAEEAHSLLAAVWLVRNTRSVFGLIPDVIGGLFSS